MHGQHQIDAGACFTNLRRAPAATQPELVVLATPPAGRFEQIVSAFEPGAHRLSEKPLSLDFAEAVHTVLAAEDAWLAGEGIGLLCPGDDAPDHSEGCVFLPDAERSG
jgi:predicted dehydrogenase